VKIKAGTQAIRLSLRTRDAGEAKTRQAEVAGYIERVWQSLRSNVRALTKKQAVALAGEVYKSFTAALEDDPGAPDVWQGVLEVNRAALSGDFGIASLMIGEDASKVTALEERFGPFVDLALTWNTIRVDAESRALVLQEVAKAMQEAVSRIRRGVLCLGFVSGKRTASNNPGLLLQADCKLGSPSVRSTLISESLHSRLVLALKASGVRCSRWSASPPIGRCSYSSTINRRMRVSAKVSRRDGGGLPHKVLCK
jgi:hypothetical protein